MQRIPFHPDGWHLARAPGIPIADSDDDDNAFVEFRDPPASPDTPQPSLSPPSSPVTSTYSIGPSAEATPLSSVPTSQRTSRGASAATSVFNTPHASPPPIVIPDTPPHQQPPAQLIIQAVFSLRNRRRRDRTPPIRRSARLAARAALDRLRQTPERVARRSLRH